MNRQLMIDIGAGTMDILYRDRAQQLEYKAVVKSPVRHLAECIDALKGDLFVDGGEMGGGPVTEALIARARTHRVVMTQSAAATLHHDPMRLQSWNIVTVPDDTNPHDAPYQGFARVRLADVDPDRIRAVVEAMGVAFAFDAVGACAQDHGLAPPGVSHLDYRHNLFEAAFAQHPSPAVLCYRADAVPATFNRLSYLAACIQQLPAQCHYVMDSGPAAVLGASLDPQARPYDKLVVLDVATSHTVLATIENGLLAGMAEYHTRDITLERLDELIVELAEGRIEHRRILEEGGHGAYVRKPVGMAGVQIIVATGPKRSLVAKSRHPIFWGAPGGDNMMTGTVGLTAAIERQRNFYQSDDTA